MQEISEWNYLANKYETFPAFSQQDVSSHDSTAQLLSAVCKTMGMLCDQY